MRTAKGFANFEEQSSALRWQTGGITVHLRVFRGRTVRYCAPAIYIELYRIKYLEGISYVKGNSK